MPTYRGSCHCGAVAVEATGVLADLESCNCSLCIRTGFVHWYVPESDFRLLTPPGALTSYQFGTMTSENPFCRRCGTAPFRRPRSDPDKIAVNVRCLEGVDLDALEIRCFDGRNWEAALAKRP